MEFAIISEGITDQIVIEAIIQGYLGNRDIILDPLQPKKGAPGGWNRVIDYCKSKDFEQSIPYVDYIIIHIDCDVLKSEKIPADCIMPLNGLSSADIFEMVKEKIKEFISIQVFKQCKNKIVFAIAIDSIECWFLPIYYPSKPATGNKTSGCIKTLNPALLKEEGFYIDEKRPEDYRVIAKYYRKKNTVELCYKMNESFKLFIDSLNHALTTNITVN